MSLFADGIALPTFGPGGMENWGLIKYQEKLLLMKEGESASSAKESIVKIVAHEIGHQVRLVYLLLQDLSCYSTVIFVLISIFLPETFLGEGQWLNGRR